MSDTCIVCLGDLSTGIDGVAVHSTTLAKSPRDSDAAAAVALDATALPAPVNANTTTADVPELVAHLQPCGHDLHDECLKPWVERANSCPICRASFHLVDLMHYISGPVISSYAVQDKTQVADLDPTLFLEVPDEAIEEEACQECGEGDNEDVLVYCDGCDKLWHTYCVELDEVPYGSWFCDRCAAERSSGPQTRPSRRTGRAIGRRRTRGMERRRRNHRNTNDDGWNSVWQSVWSRINLDLDFPFDDDEAPATAMRRHRQNIESSRREHEAWERRMRVAELANAGRQFRETESTLLSDHRPQPQETEEEIAAWDAFAEAQAESSEPEASSSRKRKRASATASPQPNGTSIKRKRRAGTSSPLEAPETSTSTHEDKRQRIERPLPRRSLTVHSPTNSSPVRRASPLPRNVVPVNGALPSFLQSLLQEVEDSSSHSTAAGNRPSPRYPTSPPAEQQSPRPSSPATSNPSSPRALSATPPPTTNGIRPSSPVGLTSSVQPIFPPIDYSPARSTSLEPTEKPPGTTTPLKSAVTQSRVPAEAELARPKPRRPRIPSLAFEGPQRTRSNDTSPTRPTLTATNKADVQKLVSTALKPHYHEQKITKDEYTSINRDVSRMLYDKIGDFEALDVEGKARWEKVAGDEVNKAVVSLRASS